MSDLKAILAKLNHNLNVLREREAKYGGNAPLELLNQISDHEQAISLTEQAVEGELSEAEWREALQPLLVALDIDISDRIPLTRQTWRPWLRQQMTPIRLAGGLVSLIGIVAMLVGLYADVFSIFFSEPTPVPPMSGDFNVAVAEFGELKADGAAAESQKGRELAEEVYHTLETVVQELQQAGFRIEVRPPALTGPIEGLNSEERASKAEQRAQGLQADLLIYGNLEFGAEATSLVPEFYLSNEKLANAEELGGQYEFGSTLQVPDNIDRNAVASRDMRLQLAERANVLAQFVVGLGYYALDRYDEASSYFAAAEETGGWQDQEGKQVFYLFQGSAAAQRDDLAAAQTYYDQALELDDRYARARLGLAQIEFLQARAGCQPDQIDAAGLQMALEETELALRGRQPPLAEIPAKTALLLGRIYLCLSAAQVGDHWAEAQDEYEQVIDDYERDGNVRLKNLAAEASADLGLLHLLRADEDQTEAYRLAAEAYKQASELSRHPDRQAVFYLWQAQIHLLAEECSLAQEALAKADQAYGNFTRLNPGIQRPDFEQFRQRVQQKLVDSTC